MEPAPIPCRWLEKWWLLGDLSACHSHSLALAQVLAMPLCCSRGPVPAELGAGCRAALHSAACSGPADRRCHLVWELSRAGWAPGPQSHSPGPCWGHLGLLWLGRVLKAQLGPGPAVGRDVCPREGCSALGEACGEQAAVQAQPRVQRRLVARSWHPEQGPGARPGRPPGPWLRGCCSSAAGPVLAALRSLLSSARPAGTVPWHPGRSSSFLCPRWQRPAAWCSPG